MFNNLKTTFLLGLLTCMLVFAGQLLGGRQGAVLAFVFAIVMNFGSYWFSDKIVLRMYGAQEVLPGQLPRVEQMVERLAVRAGIPRPRLYLIPQAQPNAFATGRNPKHAAVAVTQGIVQLMSDEELEGVIAHELAHIKHRDILISTVAATIAGAVMMLASMAKWGAIFGGMSRDDDREGMNPLAVLALAIVAPLAATMVQLAVSRSREFEADKGAVEMTGNPMGMARALARLQRAAERIPMDASPQTAHMFIVSPLLGGLARWFSTHPPIEARIEALIGNRALIA
jgi:heat shock protein HtpX